MDYKPTLNLPKTDFPMKANLPQREPQILKFWQDIDIYKLLCQKCKDNKKYILHDGPPYANGDIHIGHALNKTLKDIVVKFKTMRGCFSPFVPGWDCHGLPVEHQLFKELNITKSQIGQTDFRKKASIFAMKFVNIQKEQFKRLGVFGDWANPYLTLDPKYEAEIIRSFGKLVKEGFIYKDLKPVNWCYECETALAEAEVEYEDRTSPSIYVKFKLLDKKLSTLNTQLSTFFIIWTTTPWTLVANVAIAVHPDFEYSLVEKNSEIFVMAKDLVSKTMETIGVKDYKILSDLKGKELDSHKCQHPFIDRISKVVLADYVTKEEGTGCVHTAPGHGQEDYMTGKKYNLDMVMPVDKKGKFDNQTGEFEGMHVYDANIKIIEKLKNSGNLLYSGDVTHSYPHCWRCKSPIIFRATKQWFLKIDHKGLRKKLLDVIKKDIQWIPESGKERISSMVSLRPDWCLSRQRYWGVPIPALICNNCNEEFLHPDVIENFATAVSTKGTDCWFHQDIKEFLPDGLRCPLCKNTGFSKGSDILDVWFDSGVSHQAVLKERLELDFPCELYLEGSDQHRGWFQSSLIPAMCIDKKPPFKSVLTHGFVVDGEGRKMSKSLGNVISPQEIIKDYGADILRLWVASSDYNEDIRISQEILTRLSEAYRKIRNTARFILANLYDFNPDTDKAGYEKLNKIDKWILFRLEQLLNFVKGSYDNFEFYKAYKGIYDFCNEDLSMYYLDMLKGRLYTYATASSQRRAAQTVIYEVLNYLVRMIAPILVFTADEIWQNMPKDKKDKSITSAHLLEWPRKNPVFAQDDLAPQKTIEAELKSVIELIPDVASALEEKRIAGIIGSSFDAQIILLTNNENRFIYLRSLKEDLAEIFKVSGVNIEKEEKKDIAIVIQKAKGRKCQRCWNYSSDTGTDSSYPDVCPRCAAILKNTGDKLSK